MENGTQMTFGEYMPEIFQRQTVGASDFHVKTYHSLDSNMDFKETAQASFSELCTFLDRPQKKKDPTSCLLRMLKICLVLMEDGISPGFSLKWTGVGTMQNGSFSIPKTSEYHKTVKECSLLDILETEKVPEKYYLSNRGVLCNEPDADSKGTHEIALCVNAKGQNNWTGSFIVEDEN